MLKDSIKKENGYQNNLLYFQLNEKKKNQIEKFFSNQNEEICLDYTLGNIGNVLMCYQEFIKDFLSKIHILLKRVSNDIINIEPKTFFHEVFLNILNSTQEKFQYILMVVGEIIQGITNKFEEDHFKFLEESNKFNIILKEFQEKYELNFNNYKKYIETLNKLENLYIDNYNNFKNKNIIQELEKKKKITQSEVKSVYQNYLDSNNNLNIFSSELYSKIKNIKNDYLQYKNSLKENLIVLTKKLESVSCLDNNISISNDNEKIEKENEKEEKDLKLISIEFPLLKYEPMTFKLIDCDSTAIEILEKMINDFPEMIKEIDIETEKKKQNIKQFIYDLIELGEINEKLQYIIPEYLKQKILRDYFLKYINQIRSKGILSIKNAKSMKIFGSLINQIFINISQEENNVGNLKLIIIMSLTYFFLNKNGKKIYLSCFIQNCNIIKDLNFWETFSKQIIELDINNELKRNNDITNIKDNIIFSKILTIIQNMNSFDLPKDNIKIIINKIIDFYKLSESFQEKIIPVIDNLEDIKNNIDIEKDIE